MKLHVIENAIQSLNTTVKSIQGHKASLSIDDALIQIDNKTNCGIQKKLGSKLNFKMKSQNKEMFTNFNYQEIGNKLKNFPHSELNCRMQIEKGSKLTTRNEDKLYKSDQWKRMREVIHTTYKPIPKVGRVPDLHNKTVIK